MPAAAASADPVAEPATVKRRPGKKALAIAGAALIVLLAAGGGAAWWLMQPPAAAEAEADTDDAAEPAADRRERSGPPTFAPLDPFTVNLADREAERYAQVGVTLELDDAKAAETVKQYLPAIRHNILMVLSQKTAADMLGREGKQRLADELRTEALRALQHDDADGAPPVRAVQFSNFIIQ